MFSALHALAQKSTLMITISAEAEQLRVNVTPTPNDKDGKQALRALSLLATAEELDADFAAAIAMWQAPKQSVLEQARAAADQPDDDDEGGDSKGKSTKPATEKKTTSAPSSKSAAKAAKATSKSTKPAAKAAAKTAAAPGSKAVLNSAAQWPFPRKDDDAAQDDAQRPASITDTTSETSDPAPPTEGEEIAGDGSGLALPPVSDTPQEAVATRAPAEPVTTSPEPAPDAAASATTTNLNLW